MFFPEQSAGSRSADSALSSADGGALGSGGASPREVAPVVRRTEKLASAVADTGASSPRSSDRG